MRGIVFSSKGQKWALETIIGGGGHNQHADDVKGPFKRQKLLKTEVRRPDEDGFLPNVEAEGDDAEEIQGL